MDSPCHPYHHFRVQSSRYPWPSLLPASRQSVRHGSTVDALDRRWRPSINQNLCSPASSTRSLWISAVLHTTIHFDEVRKRKPEVHLVMMVSPSQKASPSTHQPSPAAAASVDSWLASSTSGGLLMRNRIANAFSIHNNSFRTHLVLSMMMRASES